MLLVYIALATVGYYKLGVSFDFTKPVTSVLPRDAWVVLMNLALFIRCIIAYIVSALCRLRLCELGELAAGAGAGRPARPPEHSKRSSHRRSEPLHPADQPQRLHRHGHPSRQALLGAAGAAAPGAWAAADVGGGERLWHRLQVGGTRPAHTGSPAPRHPTAARQ